MISKLTARDFEPSVLKAEGCVLVDFFVPWCRVCQMMFLVLQKVSL